MDLGSPNFCSISSTERGLLSLKHILEKVSGSFAALRRRSATGSSKNTLDCQIRDIISCNKSNTVRHKIIRYSSSVLANVLGAPCGSKAPRLEDVLQLRKRGAHIAKIIFDFGD
jgi:hypothetical protein